MVDESIDLTFRREAENLLTDIEDFVLDIEQDPHGTSIHRLFRSMRDQRLPLTDISASKPNDM